MDKPMVTGLRKRIVDQSSQQEQYLHHQPCSPYYYHLAAYLSKVVHSARELVVTEATVPTMHTHI